MADLPLLVFGPQSLDYDFGSTHPLTPRRFGPGMELLRAVGAEPGLAPEPATDDELLMAHTRHYLDVVKRFSEFDHGWMEPEAGIGVGGDDPPFHGMHDAAAAVAGGSLRAIEAILRGDVEHAFHPGGGLHHAMPSRASGFCIYDDPALAIAWARREGMRVLYVDLDVHHGDGVETIHAADPGVLTLSFHESGRYLFPGTGFTDEIGVGAAAGTVVNVPLEPDTGESAWLDAVRSLLPLLAAAFGPDLIVSQHGADSHAWDPLAHLRNTTTAMGEAARLVDAIAHRVAGGRWLATGGGGYGVYSVVPRSWSLVWLAAAHREVPDRLPAAWRERWAGEAARYGTAALPTTFIDPPNAGDPASRSQDAAERLSRTTAATVREVLVPGLLRSAADRGWWDPLALVESDGSGAVREPDGAATASILPGVDLAIWEHLVPAAQVIPPARTTDARALISAALRSGARVTAAVVDGRVAVGLAVSGPDTDGSEDLLALGVAPAFRRQGLAARLLAAHVEAARPGRSIRARVGVAERDAVEPLEHATRIAIARRLLEGAGFTVEPAPDRIGRLDPLAIAAIRR
ncbi:MAG TPA: GNAT family N-acetyltransferase [Candidatus Limnocylindrales bacterium]|nr:GNAT family N-acetyltransferase [Candidatus Limnocylindrales bacterium]